MKMIIFIKNIMLNDLRSATYCVPINKRDKGTSDERFFQSIHIIAALEYY